MSEWVSVKDRLPEKSEYVLALWQDEDGKVTFVSQAFVSKHEFSPVRSAAITHWMPLPELPSE